MPPPPLAPLPLDPSPTTPPGGSLLDPTLVGPGPGGQGSGPLGGLLDADPALKDARRERRTFAIRVLLALLLLVVMAGSLLWRLYFLQVTRHTDLMTKSEDNRMRVTPIAPVRGLLYDRNGAFLAQNLPSFNLEVTPERVPRMEETLAKLSSIVALTDKELRRFREHMGRTPKYRGTVLKTGLTPDDVARFEINRYQFPGVAVKAGLSRNYPLGQTGAHIIGYVGGISEDEMAGLDPDLYQGLNQIGKAGIERAHEGDLRGRPGYKVVEANAGGRPLRDLESASGEPGRNLFLSIDARLQLTAEQALGDDDGAVVAIDPRNGEILAMVSKPGFDPAPFVDGIDFAAYKALNTDPSRPLFNRAIQGQYPPGSTVKPFVALGGLHYGEVTPATRVFCSGTFYLPRSDRKFRCHKRHGHGSVDMLTAIAKSCDIYFYQLALNLTIDRFDAAMGAFGFGSPTGVDLPNEKGGLLPSREWKRRVRKESWLPGETVNVGIGQGFLTVTPLQMAQATARMAMRGNGYRPHLVHATEDQVTGAVTPAPTEALPPIFPDEMSHYQTIFGAMTTVVMSPAGTAFRIGSGAPYQIAGKTGTAQVSGLSQDETAAPNMASVPKHLRDHAWFMGFAPADDPKIAIAVVAEHAGHGGSAAAPIARQVMDAYLTGRVIYQPDPDHPVTMPLVVPNQPSRAQPAAEDTLDQAPVEVFDPGMGTVATPGTKAVPPVGARPAPGTTSAAPAPASPASRAVPARVAAPAGHLAPPATASSRPAATLVHPLAAPAPASSATPAPASTSPASSGSASPGPVPAGRVPGATSSQSLVGPAPAPHPRKARRPRPAATPGAGDFFVPPPAPAAPAAPADGPTR